MSDTPKEELLPHWPMIRFDREVGEYYLTQILYSEHIELGIKWPSVRLAKELPAIWLPKRDKEIK